MREYFMFGWKIFDASNIKGTPVEGDEKVAPTGNAVHHLRARLTEWKTLVLFEVPKDGAERGYRVGFRPLKGKSMLKKGPLVSSRRFLMRIGHEGCTFFAVDAKGNEVPLTLIQRIDAPLF